MSIQIFNNFPFFLLRITQEIYFYEINIERVHRLCNISHRHFFSYGKRKIFSVGTFNKHFLTIFKKQKKINNHLLNIK